jgi:hypothetical protein
MNVDLRFMFQFDRHGETLMRDFLACPPSLSEDYEIVLITIVVDISRDLERGGLERARASNVTRWFKGALGSAWQVVKPFFILRTLPKMLEDVIRTHPADQVIV